MLATHTLHHHVPNIALGVMLDRCERLRSAMLANPSLTGFRFAARVHVPRCITVQVLLIVLAIMML